MIHKIKGIEAAAYPHHMQQMQHIQNKKDLADYCECSVNQVFCLCGENWYFLAANKKRYVEVVDIASTNGITKDDFLFILKECIKVFKKKKVICDARETTSLRLLKRLETKGVIKIAKDKIWHWEGEVMHEITFRII